jgi:hypothetical protein
VRFPASGVRLTGPSSGGSVGPGRTRVVWMARGLLRRYPSSW